MAQSTHDLLSPRNAARGCIEVETRRAPALAPRAIRAGYSADNNKLLGLELLRFVSAVAVLVWHYRHFAYRGLDLPTDFVVARQPLYPVLALLYEHGVEGVRIFWCISGFIFFWRYRDAIAQRRVGGREFFVLRFSRLYPLHLVTLLSVAVLQIAYHRYNGSFFVYPYNDVRHFILQLFMASRWGLQKGDSFNGPIWSISLEVLVYGVFFFTLAFVSRSWLVNVVILIICGVARFVLEIHHPIFDCFVFFYAGGLSAIAYRSIERPRMRSVATGVAVLSAGMVLIIVWVFALYQRADFPSFFLVCYTPLLLFCLCADFKVSPATRSCIEAAGNMTYASYLLHFPFQLALMILFPALGMALPFYDTRFFCLFLAGTLLASYFVYRHFELPAQRSLRSRLK